MSFNQRPIDLTPLMIPTGNKNRIFMKDFMPTPSGVPPIARDWKKYAPKFKPGWQPDSSDEQEPQ